MNSNAIKKIAVNVNLNEDTYDNCLGCRSEVHISELNLVTGKCSSCHNTRKKYTKEQLEKLLDLDKGLI